MKTSNNPYNVAGKRRFRLLFIILSVNLVFSGGLHARSYDPFISDGAQDTLIEKKVDYIEKIYFSHGNKEELTNGILATLQQLDGKPATIAVAKQYSFLFAIKPKVEEVKESCDVLELLAAGIYELDVNEAVAQKIPRPGKKAGELAGAAIGAVNNISTQTSNLAYTGWLLSGGGLSGLGALGKLGAATTTLSNLGATFKTGKEITNTVKDLFWKDKPCRSVEAKTIAIGPHLLPDTNKVKTSTLAAAESKIIIKNIVYNKKASFSSTIAGIAGVTGVNSDLFENNTLTLLVAHSMPVSELVDKILQACTNIKFNIENTSAGGATLAML